MQAISGTRPRTPRKKDVFLIRGGHHYRIVMIGKKIFDEKSAPFSEYENWVPFSGWFAPAPEAER
ncbi:MAG: hypothetical protein DMF11_14100 [Verrucomicrobia bacterium]|nr:MAG: hypothetical protein DMF11_14100 [Verrucomicrobiota bacterium]